MYFQAFRQLPPPTIPPEVTYTVEHVVSQILTTADQSFLQSAFDQRRLAQALFEELEFLGQVPKRHLSEVRTYLFNQEWSLREIAERILKEPDNEALRVQLCQPSSFPPGLALS